MAGRRRKNSVAEVPAEQEPPAANGTGLMDILKALRQRIATRQIAPGVKLQEQALAEEFAVPRARIREVLIALEQRGLIERRPNKSAVVKRLELTQVNELYDVRESLEGLCFRLATQNTKPGDWQDLLETFRGPMSGYVEAGDVEKYIGQVGRMRERAVAAAANPILTDMLDQIYDKTQAIIVRTTLLPGRLEVGCKQLIAVLEAMDRGDAEAAERLRKENIRSQRDYLVRYQKFVL